MNWMKYVGLALICTALSAQGHPGIQQKTGDPCVWEYDFSAREWLCLDSNGSPITAGSTNCPNCNPSCTFVYSSPVTGNVVCGGPLDKCVSGVNSTGCFYKPSTDNILFPDPSPHLIISPLY